MFCRLFNSNKHGRPASANTGRDRLNIHAGRQKIRRLAMPGAPDPELRGTLLCGPPVSIQMRIKSALAIWGGSLRPPNYTAKRALIQLGLAPSIVAFLGVLFSTPCFLLPAAPHDNNTHRQSAREIVQEVVRNEEMARRNPRNYYKYIQKETTSQDTETSIRIETSQGVIEDVISINGKPPSQKLCSAETRSLAKLVTDSQVQRHQAQEQKEQSARIENLMSAVPDAFIFEFQQMQQGSKLIEINFRPNPRFQPQSHEAALLKGMRGTLWVDPTSHRLVKIEGTLFKDVEFGWGFLASLHKGGHFVMRQSRVPGGSWKQTYLEVDLDGSKLVFAQLHLHFKDSDRSFSKLENPPTLAQAVNILERSPKACRKKQSEGTTADAEFH